jgi:hypothetical protein
MMDRRYRAFLLRCWQLGDEQRFEIAHIQSGDTIRAATLGEVLAWLDHRLAEPPPAEVARPAAPPGGTPTTPAEGR